MLGAAPCAGQRGQLSWLASGVSFCCTVLPVRCLAFHLYFTWLLHAFVHLICAEQLHLYNKMSAWG
jgi:hypothetical protein